MRAAGFDAGGWWVVPERDRLASHEAAFALQVAEADLPSYVKGEQFSGGEVSIYAVADAFRERLVADEVTSLAQMIFVRIATGHLCVRPGHDDELPPASLDEAFGSGRLVHAVPPSAVALRPP